MTAERTRKEVIREALVDKAAEMARLEEKRYSSDTPREDKPGIAARITALRFEVKDLEKELDAVEEREDEAADAAKRLRKRREDINEKRRAAKVAERAVAEFERDLEKVINLFERLVDDDKALDRISKIFVKASTKVSSTINEVVENVEKTTKMPESPEPAPEPVSESQAA